MPTRVIIDCDPGHDDAMAILLAVASPELELVAVTTVAGNSTLEKVTTNAMKVLDVAGRAEIPVAAGAGGGRRTPPARRTRCTARPGLDGPDLPDASRKAEPIHAVELLAQKLREQPLTLIPTAPLTNIALLLAIHPELHERIERIVLMGGAWGSATSPRAPSSTSGCDPEAAYRVFTSGLDITLVGLDVTHRAMLSAARAEALREKGHAGAVVADLHASTGGSTSRSMGTTTLQCTMPSPSPT